MTTVNIEIEGLPSINPCVRCGYKHMELIKSPWHSIMDTGEEPEFCYSIECPTCLHNDGVYDFDPKKVIDDWNEKNPLREKPYTYLLLENEQMLKALEKIAEDSNQYPKNINFRVMGDEEKCLDKIHKDAKEIIYQIRRK